MVALCARLIEGTRNRHTKANVDAILWNNN